MNYHIAIIINIKMDYDEHEEDNDFFDEDELEDELENIGDNYVNTYNPTKEQLTIELPGLDNYDLPDDVRTEARMIFSGMPENIRKGRGRTGSKIEFYCVDNAYSNLGIPMSNKEICKLVGLASKHISTTKSLFRTSKERIVFFPDEFAISYYHRLDNYDDNLLPEIIQLCRKIIHKVDDLLDEFPQNIAVAVIKHCLICRGYEIPKHSFYKTMGTSLVTVGKLQEVIEVIDNMDD